MPLASPPSSNCSSDGGWTEFMAAADGTRPPPAKAYGLAALPPKELIASTAAQPVRLAQVVSGPDGAIRGAIQQVPGAEVFHEYLACADGPAYRFVRQIADSLMGSVWLAVRCGFDDAAQALVDKVPAERVVIKRSFVELVRRGEDKSGRSVREDPLHEVRVLKYLTGKHPSIAGLLGAYTDARTPAHDLAPEDREMFVVLEFCSGGDLFDHITATEGREENRFSNDKILRLFTDMCSAVIAMHGWGIVHRDLSPENILLDDRGQAKVCDPGQAVDKWANGPGPLPGDRDILGKNHFRAPELAMRLPHDEKVDVYSLGVILFLLFFLGMQPPPPERIAAGRLFEDVHRYGRDRWAPPEAFELMRRMTASNPRHRPSMLEVLSSSYMEPAASILGFRDQRSMVRAAAGNLEAGQRVCEGLHRIRQQEAAKAIPKPVSAAFASAGAATGPRAAEAAAVGAAPVSRGAASSSTSSSSSSSSSATSSAAMMSVSTPYASHGASGARAAAAQGMSSTALTGVFALDDDDLGLG